MLSTLRHAKLLWPTLAALVALGVLLGLGTWQLERKRWKDDLLATIAARATAAPLPVARAAEIASRGGNIEYMHVSATGRFHHDKERFLYAPAPSGFRSIAPGPGTG